jgi:hypothetical protein
MRTSATASSGEDPKAEHDLRSGTSAIQAESSSDQNTTIVMLHNLLFDRQIKLDAFILARRAQRHDNWSFGNRPLGSNT